MSALLPPPLRLPAGTSAGRAGWSTPLAALGLVVAAVLLLYRETAQAMVGIWIRSETFAHAFLVLPIVLWLVWRDRARLAAIAPRADPWLLLPIGAVAFAWLLGELAAVNAVAQFAFVALLALAVPAVLGRPLARAAAFPLAFLFFAVPFGEFLLPALMQSTADFTIGALRASGVPVFREGLNFVIPSGSWSVVEACSGVRYLIASFMVGTLYAYLTYRSTRRRLLFMAVSLAVPLLANWVRAYGIVMLGHLSNNRIATGVDHLIYGWLFFGVVIFLLFFVGARWTESGSAPAPTGSGTGLAQAVPRPGASGAMVAVATALIVLVALPQAAEQAIVRHESAVTARLSVPVAPAGGWQPGADDLTDWRPRLEEASARIDAVYARPGLPAVGVVVGHYRGQGPDRKLGDEHSRLVRSDDKRWVRAAERRRSVPLGGTPLSLRITELHDASRSSLDPQGDGSLTVWQAYWVAGRWTGSAAAAKAYGALDRLLGRGDDTAVVVGYARGTSAYGADPLIAAFLAANGDALGAMLAAAREQR